MPSVVIAANPYEGQLCRKALRDTGLQLELVDSIAQAMSELMRERPIAVVIADGWSYDNARELLVEVRSWDTQLPIFLLEDRGSDIGDEEAAIRRGATRLFVRPIDFESLAHGIEKLAVEAELRAEVAERLQAQLADILLGDVAAAEPSNGSAEPAAPTVEPAALTVEPAALTVEPAGATVEMEALAEEEWSEGPRALGRVALRRIERSGESAGPIPRVVTEILGLEPARATAAVTDVPLPPRPLPSVPAPVAAAPPTKQPEPSPRPTLLPRADETLPPVRLASLLADPQLVVTTKPAAAETTGVSPPPSDTPPRRPPAFAERSTFARRLDRELSEAERRLFPDSARPGGVDYHDVDAYDDALSDIDLDALGIDTLPGISVENMDAVLEREERERKGPRPSDIATAPTMADITGASQAAGGHTPLGDTSPLLRLAGSGLASERTPLEHVSLPLLDEEGALADEDLCALLCSLRVVGFSGRLALLRPEGEKHLWFEAGAPVSASSTFAHDRLGDLLWREGKLTREQHARTRELTVEPGRRTAAIFVELGLLKPKELFPALRRHVEEILWSCFAWEEGRFRLSAETAAAEDRVRLPEHPWALYLEGVRRKYGLERLHERVGPPETVLVPTTALGRALNDGNLTHAERAVAELFDGERSLGDVQTAIAGLPGVAIGEQGLYAIAWALTCMGALQGAEAATDRQAVRAASTVVTAVSSERRKNGRDDGERPADRAIDRERLLAKRAQIADADYFAVLGVDRDASPHEIARAWERLRRDFEPDRFADTLRDELSDALLEIHEVLDEAHRVLMDEEVRTAYRSQLV